MTHGGEGGEGSRVNAGKKDTMARFGVGAELRIVAKRLADLAPRLKVSAWHRQMERPIFDWSFFGYGVFS